MSNEIKIAEAARILRKPSYLKLDLSSFVIISKKPQDEVSKEYYVEEYGDSVYLPSPENLVGDLSSVADFLQYRNELGGRTKGVDDPLFNRKIAAQFLTQMFSVLGAKTETDEKYNVYLSKNELAKFKLHEVVEVKDLYSHISRAGSSGGRRGTSTQWG